MYYRVTNANSITATDFGKVRNRDEYSIQSGTKKKGNKKKEKEKEKEKEKDIKKERSNEAVQFMGNGCILTASLLISKTA